MTCERYESDLALYAEGDLLADAIAPLEAHLGACETCRTFLAELLDSQRMLRALGSEPLPEDSLHSVRRFVLARISRPAASHWAWAFAASLAVATVGLTMLRLGREPAPASVASRPSTAPEVPAARVLRFVDRTPPRPVSPKPPRPLLGLDSAPPGLVANPRSTVSPEGPVSPGMDPDGLFTAAPLSKEDADQLARAVVAIAAVEGVPPLSEDDDRPVVASRLIQIATSDPNVVIYWELAPTGGES